MKKYILLLFVLIGFASHSQEWKDKVNSDPAYIKYKEEAIKFYSSIDYKNEMDLGKLFRERMGQSLNCYNYNDFEKWIDKNLDKTTFKSKEEALKVYIDRKTLKAKNQPEFSRLNKEYNRLADLFGFEEFQALTNKEILDVAFEMNYKK